MQTATTQLATIKSTSVTDAESVGAEVAKMSQIIETLTNDKLQGDKQLADGTEKLATFLAEIKQTKEKLDAANKAKDELGVNLDKSKTELASVEEGLAQSSDEVVKLTGERDALKQAWILILMLGSFCTEENLYRTYKYKLFIKGLSTTFELLFSSKSL